MIADAGGESRTGAYGWDLNVRQIEIQEGGTVRLFAAIDVGSYMLGMKIFELSEKKGIKEIDYIRHRIDLGTETYNTGKISYERMEELCEILKGFKEIMNTYQVDAYRANGTSAIREMRNMEIFLDEIRLRTGIRILPLSNSEQRFLDYKSVALKQPNFEKIIENNTAFVDIGGGSVQVSLFTESKLMHTVNLRLGILRLKSKLEILKPGAQDYESLLSELIDNEIHVFKKLFLKKMEIKNLVVIDDNLPQFKKIIAPDPVTEAFSANDFLQTLATHRSMSPAEVAKELDMSPENVALFMPSAFLIMHMIQATGADSLWIPEVSLSDGIAYDYAERNHFIKSTHDFEQDIISSVETLSNRFQGGKRVAEELVQCSLAIFDSMKKLHGMEKRERLLLELSARIRDCGRYISMSFPAECGYSIIMGTEIIGLSHLERKMVATIVKNSYIRENDNEIGWRQDLDEKSYLTVTKLTAILRLATGMARSPRKKYNGVKAQLKDGELLITIDLKEGLTLEKGLFGERKMLFEEVYGVKPVVRNKTEKRF
ncbi:MAG: exopolyphosphatase [Lachnospiraceae bacterium]|nr:exopolyphosphatase [Lachnospiraceae bacterium]